MDIENPGRITTPVYQWTTTASTNNQLAPGKGLVKKLCAIMLEAEGVLKSGRNEHFKYDYVQESDVVTLFRPLLAKHGVFVFHSVEEEHREGTLTRITVRYTFSCYDTGESFSVLGKGYGVDNQDKGIYKALTGCHKYFLLKNFNLPTGDDPEKDATSTQVSPVSAPVGTSFIGGKAFPVPYGRDKGKPVGSLTPDQILENLNYWKPRVETDIKAGKVVNKQLTSYVLALEECVHELSAPVEDINM